MISEFTIHTCDLGSPSKKWKVALKWSLRANEEFKAINELEEANENMAVTPFFRNLNNP